LDFRGVVNAAIGNNLYDDGVGTAAAHMVFKTATSGTLTERMRIDRGGNLLVGLTSSISGAGQFAIDQAGGGTPIMNLIGTQSVGGGQRSVSLYFTGVVNDTGNVYGTLARISAAKENATQGNTAGYLDFATIANVVHVVKGNRIIASIGRSSAIKASVGDVYLTPQFQEVVADTVTDLFKQ
jgi:hypothetical protein